MSSIGSSGSINNNWHTPNQSVFTNLPGKNTKTEPPETKDVLLTKTPPQSLLNKKITIFEDDDDKGLDASLKIGFGDVQKRPLIDLANKMEQKIYFTKANIPENRENLLFNQFEIEQLKQKINLTPYSSWWKNVLQSAGNVSSPTQVKNSIRNIENQSNETTRSEKVEAAALAYRVTGKAEYLEIALAGMKKMSPPNDYSRLEQNINQGGKRNGPGWQRWLETGPALQSYANAYDLLKDTLNPDDKQQIAGKLAAVADQMTGDLPIINKSNWSVIAGSGLGSVAMALSETPGYSTRSQKWLDKAIEVIGDGYKVLSDGVNLEGAHYVLYSNKNFVPFAYSYEKVTGVNLLSNPKFQEMNEWLIKTIQPDGKTPPVSDAWIDQPNENRLLVNNLLPNAPVYQWLNEQQKDNNLTVSGSREAVSSLTYFDNKIKAAAQPDFFSTNFFPTGGETVFRNNWSKEAIYGLFTAHNQGNAHTHIDPGNFSIFAFGEDLILRAGYGPTGWLSKERSWYTSPESHNLLQIDGQGPADMRQIEPMSQLFENKNVASSRTSFKIGEVKQERTMYFANQRYFVVVDQLDAEKKHKYEFVLHGQGDYQQMRNDSVKWTKNGTELITTFLDNEQLQINNYQGKHSHSYGKEENHTYIKAKKEAEDTQFVSLMIPQNNKDKVSLTIPSYQSEGKASVRQIKSAKENWSDLIISSAGENKVKVENVELNSKFALISTTNGNLTTANFERAKSFSFAGQQIFESSQPIDLSIQQSELGEKHGYINTQGVETSLKIFSGQKPGVVMFNGSVIDFSYQNGYLELKIKGEGTLDIGMDAGVTAPGKTYRTPEAGNKNSILERYFDGMEPQKFVAGLTQTEVRQLSDEITFVIAQELLKAGDKTLINDLAKLTKINPEKLVQLVQDGVDLAYHIVTNYNLPFYLEATQEFGKNKLTEKIQGNVAVNPQNYKDIRVNIDQSALEYEREDLKAGINYRNSQGNSPAANLNFRAGNTSADLTIVDKTESTEGFARARTQIGKVNVQAGVGADKTEQKINFKYQDLGINYKNNELYLKNSQGVNGSEQEVRLSRNGEKVSASTGLTKNNQGVTLKQDIRYQINEQFSLNQYSNNLLKKEQGHSETGISLNYDTEKINSTIGGDYNSESAKFSGYTQTNAVINSKVQLNSNLNVDSQNNKFELRQGNLQLNLNTEKFSGSVNTQYFNSELNDNELLSSGFNLGIPVNPKFSVTTGQSIELEHKQLYWGGGNLGLSYHDQDFSASTAIGYRRSNDFYRGGVSLDNSLGFRVDKNQKVSFSSNLLFNQGIEKASGLLRVSDNRRVSPGISFNYGEMYPGAGEKVTQVKGHIRILLNK